MPQPPLHLSLLATAAVLLAACSDPTTNLPPPGSAHIRVLHATPTLGPVEVLVDGTPAVTGLTYGTTSAEVLVPGGVRSVVVRSAGHVLGNLRHSLATTHVNSLVIADSAPQFSTFVEPDTGQPIATRANIRLVNVVGSNTSAPTQLRVLIRAPNANPDSVVTSNLDATIAAYWSLMYFDPGAFDIRYVAAGDTTVLAQVTFDVAAGEKQAVVLQRAADGTYHASVMLEP